MRSNITIGRRINPADSLEILGGVVSWPDKMYMPDGCSNFAFQYKNNTGVRLLQLGFILTDPFGRSVENASEVGIDPNKSGTWNEQMCSNAFKNGLGPYIMKVFVMDYQSTQREITKEIYFLKIPSATPTPAPTVTITSTPAPAPTVTITSTPAPAPTVYTMNPLNESLQALVASLNGELKLLNAKLKKICAMKPKPKNC